MKILLIEDNKEISDNIKKILEYNNKDFYIIQIFDGEEGIKEFLMGEYDIVLLDLMLPKIDGITLCKRIRLTKSTPIIIMTAKGFDDDKILGLECGADDYIVKPFKIKELEVRIKSIMKRVGVLEVVKLGGLSIDFHNKIITQGEKIINLRLKEFQILEVLYKDKTVSRTDLLETIWGGVDLLGNDTKIDVYIYNIRKKLGKNIIRTIKGYGYSIININED